jgi:26S proteasome regulatory subunit N13
LLSLLPPATILLSAQEDDYGTSEDDDAFDLPTEETDEETIQGIILSLPRSKKERILERVLRSPQFQQSLAALTGALREGGLPSIAEALGIKVEGGGLVRGGRVPLAGGDAVRAFLEGVRDGAEAEKDEEGEGMDES